MLVPERVENGTEESVILDCIYSFDEDDDKQLVVKWFFNDDPEPIYQWIPELNSRTASDRLKGKINMDFAVNTGNPYTKYRAINLVRPTTDQSGRYVCHVASLKSEASKEASFLVYTRNIQNYPDKIDSSRYSVSGSSLSTFHPPLILLLWASAYYMYILACLEVGFGFGFGLRGRGR